jgi:hypothetical protein
MSKIELIETSAVDRGLSASRPATNPDPRPCDVFDDDQFMHEATPPDITDDIVSFCKELKAEHPVYVEVRPAEGARQGWCFRNVLDHASRHGGGPLYGWIIWGAAGLYWNAEFHCVWMQPHGGLLDITPKADGERGVLFAPDQTFPDDFNFFQRPNNRRSRVYGMEEKKVLVEAKILGLSEAAMAYEIRKADRKGLTLTQSICSKLPRDRFEILIDTFLQSAGELEAMLVPTNEGLACKDLNRWKEFQKRAHELNRMKLKLYTMADLMVRGISRFG